MFLDDHVFNLCCAVDCELHKISSITHTLSVQTTKILICTSVLSKLDLSGPVVQQLVASVFMAGFLAIT